MSTANVASRRRGPGSVQYSRIDPDYRGSGEAGGAGQMIEFLRSLVGIGADNLNPGQMALRAVLTFVVAVIIVRLGHKRLFGKGTAFDLVVAIMFGSVMSRAITNTLGLLAIWLAGFVLVMLHRLMAALAYRLDWFGPLVKGHPVLLVKDGQADPAALRDAHISRMDLDQALHETGSENDLSRVRLAYLERDGTISVIPRHERPRILEVSLDKDVQVVRIALE
ncbi:DUF421 domain-containing protein [Micromonospora arida]|uniref:DUF421 domain-containing protein n=1 Tax=Micromonospora zamorensis TaxID=709883 RepID=A0ABZ1PIW8_9ACTN|nr:MULTISPECIES: YetF domain-containing protein [Micromonospora]WSK49811.1 DUF421 domain-containing protein [Micromonospora zamorensis]